MPLAVASGHGFGPLQQEERMSTANLKIVQDLYAAFGRGDIQSVAARSAR